jgi:hypothetical protein
MLKISPRLVLVALTETKKVNTLLLVRPVTLSVSFMVSFLDKKLLLKLAVVANDLVPKIEVHVPAVGNDFLFAASK